MSPGELDGGFVLRAAPPIRRTGGVAADVDVNEWQVEPDLHRIRGDGTVEHLEPRAMKLLLELAGAGGAVVSKDELVEKVWGGASLSDEALTRVVCDLRKALRDDARHPAFIETIHKGGYRLRAEVEAGAPSSTDGAAGAPPVRPAGRLAWSRPAWIGALVVAAAGALLYLRPGTVATTSPPRAARLFVNITSLDGRPTSLESRTPFETALRSVESFEVVLLEPTEQRPEARHPGDCALSVRVPSRAAESDVFAEFVLLATGRESSKPAAYGSSPAQRRRAAEAIAGQARLLGEIVSNPIAHDKHLRPWYDLGRHDWSAVLTFLRGARTTLDGQAGGAGDFARAEEIDPSFVAPRIWGLGALYSAPPEVFRERLRLLHRLATAPDVSDFESYSASWAASFLEGNLTAARRALEGALTVAAGNGPILINLAVTHEANQDFARALETLEPLLDEGWPYPALYPQAAGYLVLLGDLKRARKVLDTGLELEPRTIDTLALAEALAIYERDTAEAERLGDLLARRIEDSLPEELELRVDAAYRHLIDASQSSGQPAIAAELRAHLDELSGKPS